MTDKVYNARCEVTECQRRAFQICGNMKLTALAAAVMGVCAVSSAARENNADRGDRWALARVSVACVREKPSHAAELGTQVVMGTPLKILGMERGWFNVECPDGYTGYVIDNSLKMMSDEEHDAWREKERVVVTSVDQTYVYADTVADALQRISDVVNGCIMERMDYSIKGTGAHMTAVRLPDGRTGYVPSADVESMAEWSLRDADKCDIIDMARSLTGTPYLWGGTSTKSMDCSGLTKICYLAEGVILPRNASAQARKGVPVDKNDYSAFQKGDLLFFGNPDTGRINHVGIYIADGKFIHCSGRVKINSLNTSDSDYSDLGLICVKRLTPADLDRMRLGRHEWY